jgi:aspartate/methionine/tyrosine aminotransferase
MLLAKSLARLAGETTAEVMDHVESFERLGKSIINLGVGQPDVPTAPHIVEEAIRALRDGCHGYTAPPGLITLREAVAEEIWSRDHVIVQPDQIVILPGAKIGIFLTMLMFGEPGAEILYPDPGFPIFRSMIEYTGAKPVPVPLSHKSGFALDAHAVLERITERTRLVVINSPSNPTGGIASRLELDKLVAALDDYPAITILSDEIYRRIHYPGTVPTSLLSYESLRERLVLLNGWSKTYAMTGWRLGYCVVPRALVDPMVRLCVNCHTCAATASQYAGIAALRGPQNSVDQMVAALAEKRRAIVDGLNAIPGISCDWPSGAFYAFPDISSTGYSSRDLQDCLLADVGVATIAGSGFGDAGEGYLRLSYACNVEALLEATRRIKQFICADRPTGRYGYPRQIGSLSEKRNVM